MNVKDCDGKLRVLVSDYEDLKEKRMSYEAFYNKYGRAEMPNFSKKQAL